MLSVLLISEELGSKVVSESIDSYDYWLSKLVFIRCYVVIHGTLTGLFGFSVGKALFFLRVRKFNQHQAPGWAKGLTREAIKHIYLAFYILRYQVAVSVLNGATSEYDRNLNLFVDDISPFGKTQTQRDFKKFMRSSHKGQK